MLYGLDKIASPFFRSKEQRLSILIYHQVLEHPDFLRCGVPTIKEFSWQMGLLRQYFNPLSLSEALHHLKEGSLSPMSVCVTFDDGYADNYHLALPVLERFHIEATVFVSTAYLNGGRMWNDTVIEAVRNTALPVWDLSSIGLGVVSLGADKDKKVLAKNIISRIKYMAPNEREMATEYIASLAESLPNDLMMTSNQIKDMSSRGVEVGGHTVTHPILTSVTHADAFEEIRQGKEALENMLDQQCRFFAYPNGQYGKDFDDDHMEIVSNLGFEAAVATDWGVATQMADRYRLPRFTPWDKHPIRFYLRLLSNLKRRYVNSCLSDSN